MNMQSLYQNILLLLIALPAYTCALDLNRTPISSTDIFLTVLFLILLTGETIADNQQVKLPGI